MTSYSLSNDLIRKINVVVLVNIPLNHDDQIKRIFLLIEL